MKNVTLKDVAKAAGVSYATVSRALSGSSQIGSETRERVLKLCDEMGYTTNFVARSMVTKRTNLIGLVVPSVDNQFMSELAYHAEVSARAHGYNIMLCDSGPDLKQEKTVFKLLLGLYPAESGTVTIGGVPVADITDRERRTCIGCVEQHFSRVPGTVLEQITLGDPGITEEMARNAAKLAGMDAAIQTLTGGYDTVCTDGMFSQGEWQLLSIARAAAADPAVLLLDEITANLDAETEARVLEALRRASEGRTVLSVSHRIYENLGGRTVEVRTQTQ